MKPTIDSSNTIDISLRWMNLTAVPLLGLLLDPFSESGLSRETGFVEECSFFSDQLSVFVFGSASSWILFVVSQETWSALSSVEQLILVSSLRATLQFQKGQILRLLQPLQFRKGLTPRCAQIFRLSWT